MRRWSRSWSRRAPERAAPVAWLAALATAAALLAALTLVGCVTRGTHREIVAERDQLDAESRRLGERVKLLEASNESLSNERVALIDSVEDLRNQRADLATSVAELEGSVAELERLRAQLSESLRSREAELEEVGRLRSTYDALVSDLQSEVAAGRVQIEQLRDGLRVNLSQEILFPLGSTSLSAEGQTVLRTVAGRLAGLPDRIEVQGHTDDLPIHGRLAKRYPSNWELGGARAARVARLLAGEGIAPGRLSALSLGATRPIAPNDSAEGRARNRRIEIRLVPQGPAATGASSPPAPEAEQEPVAGPAPSEEGASP